MKLAHKLIPVDAARNILGGIGRTKLYGLIGSGDLNVVKLGRRTFFVEAEVVAFATSLPRGKLRPTHGASSRPVSG